MSEETTVDNTIETPDYEGQAKELRDQSAKYRTQRNESLKREAAMAKVLAAHNIDFDVGKADLRGLVINNGKADGEFEYSPPSFKQSTPSVAVRKMGDSTALTLEAVKGMSHTEINNRWAEVEKLLKSQR